MNKNKKIPYLNLIPILIISFVLFKFINNMEFVNISLILGVLSPFIGAFAIAYLINPMVMKIEKNFTIPRGFSILISYIIVIGLVVFVITIITPNILESISNLATNTSEYVVTGQNYIENLVNKWDFLHEFGITSFIQEKSTDLLQKSSDILSSVFNEVINQAINVTSVVINLLLSVTISVYLLKDKENFIRKIKRGLYALLPKERARKLISLSREVDTIFSRYLIGKLIDSIIIGFLCFIVLTIMRMPYALLISVIVGITNMIPYFGPIIGAVPSVLIVLFINPLKALWVLIAILVLQQFDGLILGPKILGDQVGVKPFWVISAIVIGGALFGVLGMLIGVPVIAVIKLLVERYIDRKIEEKDIKEI
ncbi:MAG: AI-2E family transporter [Firmicutes bacterium]|nr:AI-2E family transporter [Bacillota bacterium]